MGQPRFTYQDPQTRLAVLEKVTPDEARQAFAAALETVLLVVPCGTEVDPKLPDGRPLPRWACGAEGELPPGAKVFRPPLVDRLRSSDARRARLAVDDRGLWAREPDGTVHHVPFTEVVGVEMRGPGRVVFGRDTCVIPVVPELWAGIGPAVDAVDAAVPGQLRYPASAFRPAD
ncbi:hypothetical protein [Kitasatospora sp. KL5]|uniref:hypothetical protein n=1 Tax=Kitasatospora sp. KL5 TaxID=3425125 RepID=UPI003D6F3E38